MFYELILLKRMKPISRSSEMSKIHRIGLIILFYIKTLKGIFRSVLCVTYGTLIVVYMFQ